MTSRLKRWAIVITAVTLLACQQADPAFHTFSFVSIDSQEDGNVHPLLDSLTHTVEQFNKNPAYRGELLQYTHGWDVGLRHLLNRGDRQLLLPVNLSPSGSSSEQVAKLLFLAKRYPEQRFAIPLDLYNDFSQAPPNLSRYVIFMHEVSFLAGIVAAWLSESKRIAILVEKHQNRLDIYSAPFIQGVRESNRKVWVKLIQFPNNHLSARQKSLATSLYQDGYDIIFEVTDHALPGILQAAVEQQGFVITHHRYTRPNQGRIMLQLIQRLDLSSMRLIESLSDPHQTQTVFYGNLTNGDAEISWNPDPDPAFVALLSDDTASLLPALREELKWRREQINAGHEHIHNVIVDGQAGKELAPDELVSLGDT